MAENNSFNFFGFEIKRSKKEKEDKEKILKSPVHPTDDDGAGYVTASGTHFAQYIDFDRNVNSRDNVEQIMRYRGVAMHPEVDQAIEEIVSEAISTSEVKSSVTLNMDNLSGISDKIKKSINDEFNNVLNLLDFNNNGSDIFRRWYIDGRINHHLLIDESNPKMGIQDIRYVDSTKIRKVKNVKTKKDRESGTDIITQVDEFFVYQDKPGKEANGVKLSKDSVSYVTSGILDENRKKVLSYLHKAIKPINQLRMMEDALVIYRLARAPERRMFYIDVGNLPRGKAEEYMKGIMARYRNKLVYDANTGAIRDDRKHMSMLEDFWLPRREGGKGTEVSTLPGGQNLGEMDDVLYFQRNMYKALNVPISRLEPDNNFTLGRATEISRDEVKFQKFIDKLRRRFSNVFLDILKKQLLLKNIITEKDWEKWKHNLYVDYVRDNHFTEMRDMEIIRERFQTLDMASQYIGQLVSQDWVLKNILKLSDTEIQKMRSEIQSSSDDDINSDGENSNTPEGQQPQQEDFNITEFDINNNENDKITSDDMQLEVTKQLTDLLKK
jgi:hypothetical protein